MKNLGIGKKEITKKTVFLFKKFARENKFWETYKQLSNQLNPRTEEDVLCSDYEGYAHAPTCHKKTFIQVVESCEPVELIQSSAYFCQWPSIFCRPDVFWCDLSYEWAKICIKNKLWYDKEKSLNYCECFISNSKRKRINHKEILSQILDYDKESFVDSGPTI